MKFFNVSYEQFLDRVRDRKIVHFGASSAWRYYLKVFPNISIEVLDSTLYIVDNDVTKQGKEFLIDGKTFSVKAVDSLKNTDHFVILITVSLAYQKNICKQLMELELGDNVECYSLPLMTYNLQEVDNSCVDEYFKLHTTRVNVPKIHCFWFSGEEKPVLYQKCLDSWRKNCPDFEIIEWDAENYDVTKNQYMKEAFEHRKWAFVSDYARLDVVYQYGGIYMDMDVELLAPITHLLNAESFFCRQEDGMLELGSGFGAQAGDDFIAEMLETYKDRKLILENGEMDKTPQPEWISNVIRKYGFEKCHNSEVICDRLILSNDYITSSTDGDPTQTAKLGVHWHNGSWLDEKDRRLIKEAFEAKDGLMKKYFVNYED